MKWHNQTPPTPEARRKANAVFNQVFASQVIPKNAGLMMYLDVHTQGPTGQDDGPVYRLFNNGAIDVGLPEPGVPQNATDYFVTMTVEAHTGIGRVEKFCFQDVMEAVPGDTVENLYYRTWSAMAKEHHFDSNTGVVTSWSITANALAGD